MLSIISRKKLALLIILVEQANGENICILSKNKLCISNIFFILTIYPKHKLDTNCKYHSTYAGSKCFSRKEPV